MDTKREEKGSKENFMVLTNEPKFIRDEPTS